MRFREFIEATKWGDFKSGVSDAMPTVMNPMKWPGGAARMIGSAVNPGIYYKKTLNDLSNEVAKRAQAGEPMEDNAKMALADQYAEKVLRMLRTGSLEPHHLPGIIKGEKLNPAQLEGEVKKLFRRRVIQVPTAIIRPGQGR